MVEGEHGIQTRENSNPFSGTPGASGENVVLQWSAYLRVIKIIKVFTAHLRYDLFCFNGAKNRRTDRRLSTFSSKILYINPNFINCLLILKRFML